MRHEQLLCPSRTLLLVVDIQEAFVPHIPELSRVIARTGLMIEAARLLDLPILVTEQYPKGLGRTVEPLRSLLGPCAYHEKTTFSCCQDPAIHQAIADTHAQQILLVGIETHVCIAQTCMDLLARGLQPYLATDAVAARRDSDHLTALQRLRDLGAVLTTTEAAIMEMTVSSQHPNFRQISKLIK